MPGPWGCMPGPGGCLPGPGLGGCPPGLGGIPACTEADPPVNRMTDRCKNITLPQTSFAGGNNNTKQSLGGTSRCEVFLRLSHAARETAHRFYLSNCAMFTQTKTSRDQMLSVQNVKILGKIVVGKCRTKLLVFYVVVFGILIT